MTYYPYFLPDDYDCDAYVIYTVRDGKTWYFAGVDFGLNSVTWSSNLKKAMSFDNKDKAETYAGAIDRQCEVTDIWIPYY